MRTIAVASGKGGTGKTTVTALFAHEAAASGGAVLADCDVEAANLPIALGAREPRCSPFAGGVTAEIDPRTCSACGACVDACRFGAVLPASAGEQGGYRVDAWACEGCTACARVCPSGAIALHPSRAGEACIAGSAAGPIAYGALRPGEDLSGKLVTEVRLLAREHAETTGAAYLVIDGPPGTGCPVIAAISNADLLVAVTEPSMSGEHDLVRLVGLARRLDVPVAVVLNKADLSASGAARLRALCDREQLTLLGEVPFDAELATMLARMADSADPAAATAAVRSPGAEAIRAVWRRLATAHAPSVG
ncbi:MAG: ATP-binding protein [Anaerosomatales bacterium]|nr:ATP-binding protein [Anaerosomatales bacterium]